MKDLADALRWRYATAEFEGRKISETTLEAILEAANLMPTSYGLQPFRLVVVSDAQTREELVPAAFGQRHAADNSHLVVFAIRTDLDREMVDEYIARIESTRDLPKGALNGYRTMMVKSLEGRSRQENMLWAAKQAYIALGGIIAAASMLGVDNHAMEGFDPEAFDRILALKEKNLHACVIIALGYRAASDAKQYLAKVRVPMDRMVIGV